jgi:hypothetical protein
MNKKKRITVRHLMTAANLIGLIPEDMLGSIINKSKLKEMAAQMSSKGSSQSSSEGLPKLSAPRDKCRRDK